MQFVNKNLMPLTDAARYAIIKSIERNRRNREVIFVKILFKGGNVLAPNGTLASTDVLVDGERIAAIGEVCAAHDPDQTLDLSGKLLLPGLVDAHTHGRAGFDFQTATAAEMQTMKAAYAKTGVTSIFPSLASGTVEEWLTAIERIEACGFDGVHLEGRYLNAAKRGAHPTQFLAPLNAAELDSILDRVHIPCHVSAAWELDTDGSFAAVAKRHGATMGLAHTMATADEARLAIERGAISFTHLFNAMPPLHHREGGAVCVALCGGGFGELIVDGLHVCPDMIALAWRCLGPDRTVLVTDSMQGTGCADGEYTIAGQPVLLKNGRAVTLDGALAGSTLNLWDGVKNLMRFAGATLGEAASCASRNPARMLGINDLVGTVEVGKRADLLIVDPIKLNIEAVLCRGAWLQETKGATV